MVLLELRASPVLGMLAASSSTGGYETATLVPPQSIPVSAKTLRLAVQVAPILSAMPPKMLMTTATSPGLGAGMMSSLSYLEQHKVTDATLADYTRRVREFVDLCLLRGYNWVRDEELDSVLVAIFDELFWKNRPSSDAEKLLAAVKFVLPRFRRLGAGALPRASAVLVSYSKHKPPNQRLPLPWIVLMAICGVFLVRQHLLSALKMVLSFRAYLRPGEADRLLVKCLIRPNPQAGFPYDKWGLLLHPQECGVASKVGLYDEAIPLDDAVCMSLAPCWELLTSHRPPDDLLFKEDGVETTLHFNEAAQSLHLDNLRPCRYGARHGGASEDLLSHIRTALAVKRRGRWSDDRSLKRYGKETRLLTELNKVPEDVLRFGREVSESIVDLFLGRAAFPRLPGLPVRASGPKRRRR